LRDDGYLSYFKENGEASAGPNHNLVEVWEPQVGEWCWFWNNNKQNYAFVDKFDQMTNDGKFKSSIGVYWLHCAKFDNKLPEHLKNNQKDYE
jgi:hypothetical protein